MPLDPNLVIEGLFTLVLFFFGTVLKGLRSDIRDLSEQLNSQDREALKTFATNERVNGISLQVHDLSNKMVEIQTLQGMRRGAD